MTETRIDYQRLVEGLNKYVPEHLHGGLTRYFLHHIKPGHFLTAVLENDLTEAVNRGDDECSHHLPQLIKFLWNHAPHSSWGNAQKVEEWLNRKES